MDRILGITQQQQQDSNFHPPTYDPDPVPETKRLLVAGRKIWRAWKRYSDRATFLWLKHLLLQSEQTLTLEVLRKLSPKEAELLKDPIVQARVRFRLGGEEFPPVIYYKIFTKGMNVHYLTGSRLIAAGTKAAEDSCKIMGPRLYMEKVIATEYRRRLRTVAEPIDVTNTMEYVQYLNVVDQQPPQLGGRNNGWRELSDIPLTNQTCVLLDLTRTRRLRSAHSQSSKQRNARQGHKRRANKAQKRSEVRKPPYLFDEDSRLSGDEDVENGGNDVEENEDDAELEEEFRRLFEWTRNLTSDDLRDYIVHV
ncbi:hypothetical protein BJ742DRAFT_913022 [Cladochytrium replicatum]|nr:hypothetical protein BJ742DRAFT_913022 [Cladochytrium replicatum]